MRLLLSLPVLLASSPALAAETATDPALEQEDDGAQDQDILVVAERIRGQVDTDLPPVMTLTEEDVAAYGANSIGDLITAISPQTSSGRGRGEGRPIILVNGQRISDFRVMRDLPPEAIRRMEVLPEEVALRFGYPPDQRLINLILKEDYTSKTFAAEYNVPTRGGFDNRELEGGYLSIDGPRRLNLQVKLVEESLLTEAERNIRQAEGDIPTVTGDPDPAAFRSLVDDWREITVKGNWTTGLGKDGMGGTFGLDGSYVRSDSRSLLGLNTLALTAPTGSPNAGETELRSFGDSLRRRAIIDTFEGGMSLNKRLGSWELSATANASYADSSTRIDREADPTPLIEAVAAGQLDIAGPLPALADASFDEARSRDLGLSSLWTLSGQPISLPAGGVTLTIDAGFDFDRIRSSDTRTLAGPIALKRGDLSAGANIALPIASRRDDVLAGLGDLSLNFSGGVNHLSDFGTLTDWSAGLTWSPADKLTFQVSYIVRDAAPLLGNLGNPEILTPNVPVYDFTLGQPAVVTIVTGGNPDLLAETQRDIKLSANLELDWFQRANLLVEYFHNNSDDVTQSFPLLTPAVETAFSGRIVRDASGRLVQIDRQPVTFDKIESSRLRWGFNFSDRIGKEPEGQRGGAGGERPGGGLPRMGRPGGSASRWNLSVYHTWQLTDRVTIDQGGPVQNQLAGDALAAGGVPRHSLEFEGGVHLKGGVGIRLEGRWDAPATVRATGVPGSSDLRFGSLLTLETRIFFNFDQQSTLIERAPWLKGFRVALDVDNILDTRQRVTDQNGAVPLAFQPGYRDPRGRFIGIDIRKMF